MGTRFAYEGKGLKVLWQKTLTLDKFMNWVLKLTIDHDVCMLFFLLFFDRVRCFSLLSFFFMHHS